MDGEMSAVKTADGKWWRWQFISTGGAEMLGPQLHKSAKSAKAAGQRWMEEQGHEAQPG
jgi:hypothetical protein